MTFSQKISAFVFCSFLSLCQTWSQGLCRNLDPSQPCTDLYKDLTANNTTRYVNLYIYVIRDGNSGGATHFTDEMLNEALDYLDKAFSPHNIFFVRKKYGANCTTPLDDDELFNMAVGTVLMGFPMPNDNLDGINLYFFPERDLNSDGGGVAYTVANGVTSNQASVIGRKYGQSIGRSFVLAHEVGHCLGLCHTFNYPIGNVNGSDWRTTCDRIQDTPPDFDDAMFNHQNLITCSWTNPNTNLYGGFNPSTTNIMSNALPNCMKEFTADQGTIMRNNLGLTTGTLSIVGAAPPLVISSDVTFSTNQYFERDIFITNGAQVIVNPGVTLSFSTNNKIKVDNIGGGGTLHLKGKVTSGCWKYWGGIEILGNPNAAQLTGNQGKIITYSGSIIENALVGINCPTGKSGGIIDCKWTTFRNNNIAVSINKYELSNSYKAKFSNCTFITDNNFKPNYRGGFEAFAKLNLVRGVTFNACTFENLTSSIVNGRDSKGYGIYSLDAGFNLTYGATQGNACCVGGNMKGLSYGVYQANTNGKVYAYNVDNTTFENCYTGIYVSAAFGGKMITNTFNMGGAGIYSEQWEQYGIALNGNIDGYILEENTFSHNLGGILQTIGTSSVGTGTFNNILRRNHYYGLTRANEADLVNGSEDLNNNSRGLTYLCNTNAGTQRFDFLNKDALKRVQGLPSSNNQGVQILAAGNTFTHSFANTFSDFNNNWIYSLNYHHLDNNASQTPTYTQNFVNIPSAINTCIQKYCPQPCIQVAEEDRTTLKLAYFQNQNNYITRLNSVSTSSPPTVYTEMNYYKTEADRAAYLVVDSYINDTLGYEEDTLRVWLGRLDTYTAKWRGNLAQPTTLTAAQQNDWSNLQQIQTILQSESLNNLSTTSINTLQTMAHNPYGLSWVMAKNVLQENGFHNYPYWVEEPIEPRNNTKSFINNLIVYPNPSNGNFTFNLNKLQKSGLLSIWNCNGSKVFQKNIFDEETIQLNNETGIYFYSLLFENGLNVTGKLQISN